MENTKKLSRSIERTRIIDNTNHYSYKFTTRQFLENIDNYEYFGIDHNSVKEKVIDGLVQEFRIHLNSIIFNDPAGTQN